MGINPRDSARTMWEHCDVSSRGVSFVMADGFDIHLNEDQARRLKAAAEASGVDPSAYALQLLEQGLDDGWSEDFRRAQEYEHTGESIGADEWMQVLREAVHTKFKA
jgi:hypothetical protein